MRSVLLVDDAETMRAYEKVLLGKEYVYLEAANGEEGLAAARANNPDIVLLDVNMPILGGIETLRRLKQDPATAVIPVVMVTTCDDAATMRECEDLGCSGFITKPVDPDLLRATVRRLLGISKKAREPADDPLLANLYALLSRLHGSLELPDVVSTVHETIVNLVGSEDFGLYLRDGSSNNFERVGGMGPSTDGLSGFPLGEGLLGQAADSREICYGEIIAGVPLRIGQGSTPIGVAAIFTLLHGRSQVSDGDRAVLELLADHAGLAIEACMCASQTGRVPLPVAMTRALLAKSPQPPASVSLERDLAERSVSMAGSLVLRCHDRYVAFPLAAVVEVFRMVAVNMELLDAPDDCLGVVNCHGRLLPILDLSARLGLCPARTQTELASGHVVVVRESSGDVGYAVDDIKALYEGEAEPIVAPAEGVAGSLVMGAVVLGEEIVAPLLDQSLLLSDSAREAIRDTLAAIVSAQGGRS